MMTVVLYLGAWADSRSDDVRYFSLEPAVISRLEIVEDALRRTNTLCSISEAAISRGSNWRLAVAGELDVTSLEFRDLWESEASAVRITLPPGSCVLWCGEVTVKASNATVSLGERHGSAIHETGAGRPEEHLIVIDGFYAEPDKIRNWAVSQAFNSTGAYGFPGFQATKAMQGANIKHKIELLMQRSLHVDPKKYTFGGFRLISEDSGRQTTVHSDGISDWAAMIYLTPDAPVENGTGFYRHIKTGLSGPPSLMRALKLGYGSPSQLFEAEIKPVRRVPSAWSLEQLVGPLYNRFIAFRGQSHYHAPLGGSGASPTHARLTHMFFYDNIHEYANPSGEWDGAA